MKAKDITPGDYEVKHYTGLKKITIVSVERRDTRVYDGGRDVVGHLTKVTYAVADTGEQFTLGAVVRPWSAEVAASHDAVVRQQQSLENAVERLEAALVACGIDGRVSLEGSIGNHWKKTGKISLVLVPADAEALATKLSKEAAR
jgi:hypothetical protein